MQYQIILPFSATAQLIWRIIEKDALLHKGAIVTDKIIRVMWLGLLTILLFVFLVKSFVKQAIDPAF